MRRQIACAAEPVQPSPHWLSRRVCYRSLDNMDAAFALPLSARNAIAFATGSPPCNSETPAGISRRAMVCDASASGLGAGSTHVAVADDRAPIWPDGVIGSITHTGDFAAAAVAWAADVAGLGIDSEQIIDPAAAGDIADICMVNEAMLFKVAQGRSFCEFCTFVFSAKEAVFKCLFPHTRKFLEFSDVRITSFDWNRRHFAWTAAGEHSGMGRLSHAGRIMHTSVELSSLVAAE